MKITTIKYSHEFTFHGLSRWVGMEASIDETDDEKQCLHKLEQTAKDFVQESFKESNKTTTTAAQPPEPIVMPVIQAEKNTTSGFQYFAKEIKACTTIEELESFRLIANNTPGMIEIFNEQMIKLKA